MMNMNKIQYKQFEIKGYEQMIERIMQQPLQKAIENNNSELSEKLMTIKDKLTHQNKKNRAVERAMEDQVIDTVFKDELQQALKQKAE